MQAVIAPSREKQHALLLSVETKKSGNHRPAALWSTLYCAAPVAVLKGEPALDLRKLAPGVRWVAGATGAVGDGATGAVGDGATGAVGDGATGAVVAE